MSKAINLLTSVKTKEVSLVRAGANNKRFALTKSENLNMDELLVQVLNTPAEGEEALVATLKSQGADEEAVTIAKANYRLQTGFKDKLDANNFNAVTKASGMEAEEKSEPEMTEEEKAKAKKEKEDMEDTKEMPAELKKAFDAQAATIAELKKAADEKDARIVAIEKEAKHKEYIAKCEKKYSHLPGMTTEEQANTLSAAYEVSKEFGESIEAQWEKTCAVVKSGVVNSGFNTVNDGLVVDAEEKIQAIAKSYMDSDSKMTEAAAIAKAYEENPALYQAYLSNNPKQVY